MGSDKMAGESVVRSAVNRQRMSTGEKRVTTTWRIAQGLAVFFGLTYGVLFFDVLLEHHFGLASLSLAQLVPVVFSPLAAAVAITAGLWPKRGTLNLFAITMGISVLVGLMGAYFHLASSLPDFAINSFHVLPPKLAPLAFSGIGAMGLLITVGFFKPTWQGGELVFDPVCKRYIPSATAQAVMSIETQCQR